MNPPLLRRLRPYSSELSFLFKAFAVCLIAAICVVMPAGAVDGNSKPENEITLSPTRTNLKLEKGQNYSGSFKVINSGWKEMSFRVYASPYQVANENYDPIFIKENNRTQISRWVSFPEKNYVAEPNETIEVKYNVKVPENIPDGGQYAVLFAETDGGEGTQSAIVSKKRVGTLLYAKTNGNTVEAGEADISSPGFIQSSSTVNTDILAKNTGNTDFDINVKQKVASFFGGKEKIVFDKSFAVLPETNRKIVVNWDDASFGIYKITTTTELAQKTKNSASWVVVLPPAVIYTLILLTILIVSGLVYVKSRRK